MLCSICQIRKARRSCPGVHSEICTICCAEGREETIDCPLECEYLRDAHRHEKLPELDPAALPNQDIEVTESFVQQNEMLLAILAIALYESIIEAPPAVADSDVREALEALIRTWRTMQSGLIYESRPDNPYAAEIAANVKTKIDELRQREMEASGLAASSMSDRAILGTLAFFQRLEYSHNNSRRRSRAFIDFLSSFYPGGDAAANIEQSDAPRVIL